MLQIRRAEEQHREATRLKRRLVRGLMEGNLPLDPEITSALLGESCRFRTIYDTILAFEQANWGAFSSYGVQLGIDENAVQSTFAGAAKWAADAMGLASGK